MISTLVEVKPTNFNLFDCISNEFICCSYIWNRTYTVEAAEWQVANGQKNKIKNTIKLCDHFVDKGKLEILHSP